MSRFYVPWPARPKPQFRGVSGLIASLAVGVYSVAAPVVRALPGFILLGVIVASGFAAWAVVGAFQDLAAVRSHLAAGGGDADAFFTVEQLRAAGEQLSRWTPAYVLWPLQSLLLRDLLGIAGVVGFASLIPVFAIWWERKVSAHMQSRVGPMRTGGWHGWSQSFADGVKLIAKEDFVPAGGDKALFLIAPYLAFVPVIVALVALPFGTYWVFRDLDVGLLFILAALGLEVLSVILAGWASNNKWALFGAMREACQVISYEIPMGMSLLIPVMVAGSLRFADIAELQSGGWFTWLVFHSPWTFVAAFTYFISSLASCKRAPFDLPEGESELVSGFHTEYSGFRWSLFFFAEYVAMFIVSALLVILFLGAWHSPWPAPVELEQSTTLWGRLIYGLLFNGPVIFILKCLCFIYVQLWLRWTLPRIRIDQVLYSCIQVMLPLVLVMVLASTFWELFLSMGNPVFGALALVVKIVLGVIGLIVSGAALYTIWYGFANRRPLVGTLAVDLLPGA